MEDSSEVHSEENKVSPEKNKKRRLKTPAQVMALEKFYNEHNYPTEEMKSQLAEELGLTEKQISGWFCHRRLKDKRLLRDEACANGRQDRSSVVIQDRGSGLRQDSCGSTKQGDCRNVDPREVESRRLYSHDFSAADLTYQHRSEFTGNVSAMDNTSSESSSSLQDRLLSQIEDPYEMGTSRCLTQHGALMPVNLKGTKNIKYKPSGYLKVKGEIENAAITAVKRQLGRHYQEDGPPLGVEFQPLPPGAFESPRCNSVNDTVAGPIYVGNPRQSHSPDQKQPSLETRYEVHNSKMSSQDSHMEGANCNTVNGSDCQDRKSHRQLKKKSSFLNYSNRFPGQNSSLDIYEDSAKEPSVHNSTWNYKMSSKPCVDGIRSDYVFNHHGPYGGKTISEQTKPSLHGNDNLSPKIVQKSEYWSKPSKLTLECSKSLDTEEGGPSTRMAKVEKLYGERKAMKEYRDPVRAKVHPTNEMKVSKRVRVEFPQQGFVTKASDAEMPSWKNQMKRPAVEIPSSFSEDETAETSSSSD